MTKIQLDKILAEHLEWLQDNTKGSHANLSGADLSFTCVISFYLGRDMGFYHNGRVKIGCCDYTLKTWLTNYQTIGKANGYTKDQIALYGMQLKLLAAHDKTLNKKGSKK